MTTYNTNNPVPSVDVRDLYDNTENLDNFSNAASDFAIDRLGVSRETLQGIRNASQYQLLGAYAAGLQFTSYNQTFRYLGEFYAPSAGLDLPYTTTGSGAGEIASFRSVGDALLRQDLSADTGAGLVGWAREQVAATIATVGAALSVQPVSVWEFADLIVSKPTPADPSTWDWRPAIQGALDSLEVGGQLVIPEGLVCTVVNATGSGATPVLQRADAVANGTLYPLTCATDRIRVHINGEIRGTSILGDVMRLSGDGVVVTGGRIRGPGQFLDTLPAGGVEDLTVQWYPSLLELSGNDAICTMVDFYDPPTIGAYAAGQRPIVAFNTQQGGLTTHGSGTNQFGIYGGSRSVPTSGGVFLGNRFTRSAENGATYTGIFNTCADSLIIDNVFHSLLEHGVYNYAAGCKVLNNVVDTIEVAAGIQNFATNCDIGFNTIKNAPGAIALQMAGKCKVYNNRGVEGITLSGISVRRRDSESASIFYDDMVFADNDMTVTGGARQVPLDIQLDCGYRNLKISGGTYSGAKGAYGNITVLVSGVSANPGFGLSIENSTSTDAETYGIYLDRAQSFEIDAAKVVDVNTLSSDIAIRAFNSQQGICRNVIVSDTRDTKKTGRIFYADSADGNGYMDASGNRGYNLLPGQVLVTLPTGSLPTNNTDLGRNTVGIWAALATPDLSWVVNTGAALGIRGASASVVLTPVSKEAWDIQAGVTRIYVSAIADGQFTLATSNGGGVLTTGAVYKYEVIQ